ncbi:MAG: hypothetical protein ABTQ32_09255 [Myxococcaceae bacterium]
MSPALLVIALSTVAGAPEPPLLISTALASPLSEPGSPPVLTVELENVSSAPVSFMRFESARCFVHFSLRLSLRSATGTETPNTTCPIRAWPGVKSTLAPKAKERRTLALTELFPSEAWAAGRYELDVAWDPAELRNFFDGAYAPAARESVRAPMAFTLLKPIGRARAMKGTEVTFSDGARFTLLGRSGAQVVSGTFSPDRQNPLEPFTVSATDGVITLRGRTLVVGRSGEGWMELMYFGALAPDSLPAKQVDAVNSPP